MERRVISSLILAILCISTVAFSYGIRSIKPPRTSPVKGGWANLLGFITDSAVYTTLKVLPIENTFFANVTLPGTIFIVNATVENVTDLQNWQIKLTWNSSLLSFVNITRPPDHVFAASGKDMIGVPVDSGPGYVLWGCTYINGDPGTPEYWTFNGTGTLCKIALRILDPPSFPATTDLTFGELGFNTFLVNGSTHSDIPFNVQIGRYRYVETVPTPTGLNVTVSPVPDVGLVFENVTSAGFTGAYGTQSGPPLPGNLTLVGQYYDISTNAGFSGNLTVSVTYDDSNLTEAQENSLQLLQWQPQVCDVTGPTPRVPDGIVNMRDIGYFAAKFMTTPSSPNWDARCDVTGSTPGVPDGTVNMRDIGEAARNFMKTSHWTSITTYVDTVNNVIYGEVSHLSMFGVTRY